MGTAGPTRIKTPFSMSDLDTWKEVVKGYRDDPEGVAKRFELIVKNQDPDWKDIDLMLDALTETEKQLVIKNARTQVQIQITAGTLPEVTNPASIKAAAARVGEQLGGSGLNLLINNAAIVKLDSLDTATLENMTQVYTTNTIGPLLVSQAFLPLLKKAAQGSPGSALSCSKAAIINMSSIGGSIDSPVGWDLMQAVSYRCSKTMLGLLHSMGAARTFVAI
ncbi:uncharacterized protein AAHN32_006359 [Aegotheles albertisi]